MAVDVVGSILLIVVPTVNHDAPVIPGSTVFAGFASALWPVLIPGPRRRITPPHLTGRVSGAYRTPSVGSMAVRAGLAALLVRSAGIRMVVLAFTVAAPLAVIPFSLWRYPNSGVASVAAGWPA